MRSRCAVSETLEGGPCRGSGMVEFLGELICEHHARQFKHMTGEPEAVWEEAVFHIEVALKDAYRRGSKDDVRRLQIARADAALELRRVRQERALKNLQVGATRVRALLGALGVHDPYTRAHSEDAAELSVVVAREMGLSPEQVAEVEQAALLHDIGKIGVPRALLNKPGPLEQSEWKLIKEHPVIGVRIVASIEVLSHLAPLIRAGHERWDGQGYPDGLKGEQIPLASRIIFCCDAYETMISDRPYCAAMSARAALEEIETNAGGQFCPYTVRTLVTVLRGIPAGGHDLGGGEP
jgi:HD-GYP domain-containing protein (c-di-GMP phosphodiesterase class II)